MDKNQAKSIISSREVIPAAGKYRVKVTTVTAYHRALPNGSAPQVGIANFNAMTPYHIETAKALYSQGEYQAACNQNLSMSIRETDYQPTKGEIVDIVVAEVTTSNQVTGLFVTSMTPVGVTKTSKLDMDAWDIEEPRVALEPEQEPAETSKKPAFK